MKIFQERFGLEYNPQKEKNKKNKLTRQIIVFMSIFIVLMGLIAIVCQSLIRNNLKCLLVSQGIDSVWIGSLASYWGGIIGGIFSGTFAFLGVFYTIKYYKESDIQKEKASIQPFLLVTVGVDEKPTKGFEIGKETTEKKEQKINITIKNIGNGFANTLTLNTGYNLGGFAYKKAISPNETESIYFKAHQSDLKVGIKFYIQYIDSMRNEYMQQYEIKEENGIIDIDSGYPAFLEQ